jgi:hypothetical protein
MTMKAFGLIAIILSLGLVACSDDSGSGDGPDAGHWPVREGFCDEGTEFDNGTSFYVDPVAGDDANDGSEQNPWQSIQNVVETKVDCVDRDGLPHHTDAPVKGGDTIYLVGPDGHDLDVNISGCYNTPAVRIKALNHHEPRVAHFHFRGSAGWRIEGLLFHYESGDYMIRLEDQDSHGEAYDIEIFNNYFTSGDLTTLQEYADLATDGIRLLHGAENIVIRCNHLYKVAMGIVASGDGHQILGNIIEFFTRDGIVAGGRHTRFIGNQIYNSVKLGDGHHDDFFQSHMGANPDVSSDVEIAYNIFMNLYPADQPQDTIGPTQCLSAFGDGPKTNIRIYNNVCRTDHYHGITWNDTHDSVIINNTVLGGTDMPDMPPGSQDWPSHSWISVEGGNNIVRNNLCTNNFFADWADRTQPLELLPTAPAVNAGSPDQAPADDILGNTRDETPDVGAYEYVP